VLLSCKAKAFLFSPFSFYVKPFKAFFSREREEKKVNGMVALLLS